MDFHADQLLKALKKGCIPDQQKQQSWRFRDCAPIESLKPFFTKKRHLFANVLDKQRHLFTNVPGNTEPFLKGTEVYKGAYSAAKAAQKEIILYAGIRTAKEGGFCFSNNKKNALIYP